MGVGTQALQDCFIHWCSKLGEHSSKHQKYVRRFSSVTLKNKVICSSNQTKWLILFNSVHPPQNLCVVSPEWIWICLPWFGVDLLRKSLPIGSESIFKFFTFLLSIWQYRTFPVTTKKKNTKEVRVGNQQSGNTNTFLIENYSFPSHGR